MYCKDCGKKIDDEAKFCPFCGGTVENEDTALSNGHVSLAKNENRTSNNAGSQMITDNITSSQHSNVHSETQENHTSVNDNNSVIDKLRDLLHTKKGIAVALVIALIVFVAVLGGDSSDVAYVKQGHFYFNQTRTVEEGFNGFFANPKWDSKVVNDVHYVYFTGDVENTHDKSHSKMKISFRVNPKTSFEVIRIEINGRNITSSGGSVLPAIMNGNTTIEYTYDD